MVESKANRNTLLDILRCWAIILVVVGHCIEFGSGGGYYLSENYIEENLIFKIIYSFHMPLFTMISGYLFYYSINRHNVKQILLEKTKSLVVPNVPLTLVNLIIMVTAGNIPSVKIMVVRFLTAYWFLWGIFYCTIIVLIVNKLLKDNVVVYIIGTILSVFVPDKLEVHTYKFLLPFFIIGYLFNKYYKKGFDRKKLATILITCIVFYAVGMFFWNKDSYIYFSKHCIIKEEWLYQLYLDIYRTIIGLLGSVIFIILTYFANQIIKNTLFNKVLCYIGKQSMGIYVFSMFINYWILPKITYNLTGYNIGIVLIESILMVVVCLGLTWIAQTNKITKLLFLGGR